MQPPAYVQVTTFAVSGRLNATNYNQLTDGATESNDTASGALEYHVNSRWRRRLHLRPPYQPLGDGGIRKRHARPRIVRLGRDGPGDRAPQPFRFPYRVGKRAAAEQLLLFSDG